MPLRARFSGVCGAAAFALVLASTAASSSSTVSAKQDVTEGLTLAGRATRVQLLGQVKVYSVSLFMPPDGLTWEALRSADVRKDLRIEIHYEPDLHTRVPIQWQTELIPELQPADMQQLRGAFAPLRAGDVILVVHTAGKGTTVRVNERIAVSTAHHDLMLVFLDRWLGQRPIADEMKAALSARLQ